MAELKLIHETNSESFYHKAIKQMIFRFISQKSPSVIKSSTEKCFNSRRADVYFEFKDGKEAVVEVQHSKIPIKEIIKRTEEYNNQNIYVLWILHGEGKCVASPKNPEHKKKIRISSLEKFLHKMYGGRVYYVKINENKNRITITQPFALHYSHLGKKSLRSFRKGYEYYYIRNSNFRNIPNWNLLCTKFNNFKIARFFDKNIKIVLKEQILNYILNLQEKIQCDFKDYKQCKKLFKIILKKFKENYGKIIITESFKLLNKELQINEKFIRKRSSLGYYKSVNS